MPPEQQMSQMWILSVELVFIAAMIERAVAQIKALVRLDRSKPWPVVSLGISFLVCAAFQLRLIQSIVQLEPRAVLFMPGQWVDIAITSLILAGGSAGLVNAIKRGLQRKADLHALKTQSGAL